LVLRKNLGSLAISRHLHVVRALLHECRLRIDHWVGYKETVDNIGRYRFVIFESTLLQLIARYW